MSVASPTEPPNITTMKDIKTNIIGAVAILAFLGVLVLFATPTKQSASPSLGAVSNTNAPAANTSLVNGQLLPNPSVWDYGVFRQFLYTDKALGFGNSSGTAILQQAVRTTLTTATTSVICSLQSPFTTASSTFEAFINIASTSANAGQLAIATSTTNAATTSPLGTFSILANTQFQFAGSGTTTTGNIGIVGPSQYVNIGGAGTPTATTQYGGTCGAIFTSTN